MNKEILENNGYKVYKEDDEYFYAVDKDNYYYNFKKTYNKIFLKNICKENVFSIRNIKQYIKNNNLPIQLVSDKFYGTHEKLLFKDINSHIFERSWHNLMSPTSLYLCPKCTLEYKAKERTIKSEVVKQEYFSRGLILLDEYINNRIPMLCKNKDGYLGKLSRQNLSMGKTYNIFSTLNEYTIYNIKKYLENNDIPLELLSQEYKGYNKSLLWKCKCGNSFKRTFEELVRRKVYRCPICTRRISENEFKVEKFLKNNNIDYIKEYKFKDCIYKKEMPFDFYLNKYNICIEVQGEQHYKPVGFGNIKFKKSIENFILQRKRDKIKENYCKENNISLLKISYIDIQNGNYKNIISYKLSINK